MDKIPKKVTKNRETKPKITIKKETKPTDTPKSLNDAESPENTALAEYTNKTDVLFKDIILPEDISPEKNNRSLYNIQLAVNILVDIAVDGSRTIEKICNDNGIAGKTVHLWGLYSEQFLQCYHRAQEMRQDAKIRDIERLETDLDEYIEDDSNNTQEKGIRIQRYRTRTLSHFWQAARLNKRYQEKTQQDTNITVDHANLRADAWEQAHQPTEIPHTEVPADNTPPNNETDVSTNDSQ